MNITDLDRIARELESVPGDCAEFGCYEGECTIQIARTFKRRTWAWDTFTGMPDDGYDPVLDSSDPPGKWTPQKNTLVEFANTKLDIIPIVGKYSFTIPRWVDEIKCEHCGHGSPVRFAFVHIDCDHYNGFKQVLKFIAPRMSSGGVVRMDDIHLPGVKKAIEEFIAVTKKEWKGEFIRF